MTRTRRDKGDDGRPAAGRRPVGRCSPGTGARGPAPPPRPAADGHRRLPRPQAVPVRPQAADHHPVPAAAGLPARLHRDPAADRRGRRHHGGRAGPAGLDGLRRHRRAAGHCRALLAAAAAGGVRPARLRALDRGRPRVDHLAAGRRRAGPAGPGRQHRVRDDGRGARAGRRRDLPRRPAAASGLDRRLLLPGGPRRVHHRGRDRHHRRAAGQAGRGLQRPRQRDPGAPATSSRTSTRPTRPP